VAQDRPKNPIHRRERFKEEPMNSITFTRRRLAFLLGVPLAWALLLVLHGPGPVDGVYETLHDETTRWLIVHFGTLPLIGLLGVALYLLVRELPGTAARISRLAIGPFVLFYAAGEAIQGVATGVLVDHANGSPLSERQAVADAAQALYDSAAAEWIANLGAVAWVVAVITAAVAYRRVGAPTVALMLLGLSAITISHATPVGSIGLVCFAAAVGLIARGQGASKIVESPAVGAKA
jgi:hypothetical protein